MVVFPVVFSMVLPYSNAVRLPGNMGYHSSRGVSRPGNSPRSAERGKEQLDRFGSRVTNASPAKEMSLVYEYVVCLFFCLFTFVLFCFWFGLVCLFLYFGVDCGVCFWLSFVCFHLYVIILVDCCVTFPSKVVKMQKSNTINTTLGFVYA